MLKQPRTKELVASLSRWGVAPEAHALIIVAPRFGALHLAGRNLSRLRTNTIANLSVYDLLRADKIIVEASALAFIQEFYGASREKAESALADSEEAAEGSSEPAE